MPSDLGSVIVQGVKRGRPLPYQLGEQVRVIGEQRFAHRGRVERQQRADLEHLGAVIGTEDVMHDQHLAVVQGSQPHPLVAARGQRVSPVERPVAELVAVQVAAPEVEQRGSELVLARLRVLLDESDLQERPQDPEHGPLGKAHLSGRSARLSREPARRAGA